MKTKIMYFVLRAALISLMIFGNSGCSPDDDLLSSTRTDYTGNQLRLDGYYYYNGSPEYEYMEVYFLYRNGIILWTHSFKKSDLLKMEELFKTGDYIASLREHKDSWGLYLINNNTIQFELWYPAKQDGSHPAGVKIGEIINDTTFHISSGMRSNGTEKAVFDETYHFKRFSPKPDSTNNFIK